uniref:Uncharacterized protein n=1 Tax=Oryza rufipogon TaxID=4529 RepID=A0A0E0Q0E2_ORYRU
MARTLGHLQPRPPLHSLLPSSALSSLSTPPLSSPPHPPRCPPAAGQRGGAGSGATQATRRAVGRRMCRRRKGQAQVADGGSGAGAGGRCRERHGLSWPTVVGQCSY